MAIETQSNIRDSSFDSARLRIEAKKNELARKINDFLNSYKRNPSIKDWDAKRIEPSVATFYKYFSSLDEAINHAIKKRRSVEKRRKCYGANPKGFPCPFCGTHITGVDFYDDLKDALRSKLLGLLNVANGDSYFNGVMLSIEAIFGNNDGRVEQSLEKAGYLEAYNNKDKRTASQCEYCGNKISRQKELPPSALITIIIGRLVNLLKAGSNKSSSSGEGIKDALRAIFGKEKDNFDLHELEPATIEISSDLPSTKEREWNWNELFKYRSKPGKSSDVPCHCCGRAITDWEAPISFASGKAEFVCKSCSKHG